MKKLKNVSFIMVIAIIFVACKKKVDTAENENSEHANKIENRAGDLEEPAPGDVYPEEQTDIYLSEMSPDKVEYMAALPELTSEELVTEVANYFERHPGGGGHHNHEEVWGIGYHNRVYRWNEVNLGWDEPEVDRELRFVDVASGGSYDNTENAVWGIGMDHEVLKWDGSTWNEPNGDAAGYLVSALSHNFAVGIGAFGRLYKTENGGDDWKRIFPLQDGFKWVSINEDYLFAITSTNDLVYIDYAYSGATWQFTSGPGTSNLRMVSAKKQFEDVWTIQGNWRIHSGNLVNPLCEENEFAGLVTISGQDGDLKAWGIGGPNTDRIFRTFDRGESWEEPDPDARLFYVSAGYNI